MTFHKLFYFFSLYSCLLIFKLCYRLKVYGREHFIHGGAIIASNHVSFLDPPVIAVACKEEIHFLARHTLFKSLFGKLISFLNAHPVQKDDVNLSMIRELRHLLKSGNKVLLFPEGERSNDNRLRKVQPGVGLLVSKSESAIIPTYVHGTYEVWGCHRRLPKIFGKICVIFGTPILWEDYADMGKREAKHLILQHLSTSISNLQRWHESGAEGSPP